jgi:hypothetical protein
VQHLSGTIVSVSASGLHTDGRVVYCPVEAP